MHGAVLLKVPQLVSRAALHLHPRPRRQRLVQSHVTVHHHQDGRHQSSLLQIDDHLAPVRGRLTRRQPQPDENLLAVLPHAQHGQHWSRHDALRHLDLQVEPVEEQHSVALSAQIPMVPALEELLQPGDNTGNRAPGEMLFAEQGLERLADPPAVGAGQVAPQNRRVDVLSAPGVSREQFAPELSRRAVLRSHVAPRDHDVARPGGRGDAALLADFRKRAIGRVANPQVRRFWLREFERYPANFRAEALAPVQNKVGRKAAST